MVPNHHPTAPSIAVVSIGEELLAGAYPDRNAGGIARALLGIGLRVQGFHVVGDGAGVLSTLLSELGERCDAVVVSGGLGPTEDDRTRSEAARAVGVELLEDAQSLEGIRAWFESRQRRFTEANRCQALFPRGAQPIPNRAGTAPGFALGVGRARCYFLPGPPHEMEAMLREAVLPALRELPGRSAIASRQLHCYGISESILGQRIRRHLEPRPGRLGGITVSRAVHTITLSVAGDAADAADAEVERWAAELAAEVDDVLFGRDGETLQAVLVKELIAREQRISTAESCTAGMVASAIADIPGASTVLEQGVVAYANRAKIALLGVRATTLEAHGAVSAETALELADGARRTSGAELAVAITGIAGPGGDTPQKPVGLVFFGVSHGAETRAWRRLMVPHGRQLIREVATREALYLSLRTLQGRAAAPCAARPYPG